MKGTKTPPPSFVLSSSVWTTLSLLSLWLLPCCIIDVNNCLLLYSSSRSTSSSYSAMKTKTTSGQQQKQPPQAPPPPQHHPITTTSILMVEALIPPIVSVRRRRRRRQQQQQQQQQQRCQETTTSRRRTTTPRTMTRLYDVVPDGEGRVAATIAPLLFVDETKKEPSSALQRSVSDYYGKTLSTSDDLKTDACCTAGTPPQYILDCLSNIHETVLAKYYGCGLCLPQYDLTGLRILDLGCGAGRDVYIASQLVGPHGSVVGVDMTPEQLDVARSTEAYHTERFGYDRPNVEFYQGFLERLDEIPELYHGPAKKGDVDRRFDVIISNCVINLCQDKRAVLEHCRRLLKPGGEMYFSDVYATRRVPPRLREDEIMWGECLSGALYWNDFENLARHVGFPDPRLVEDSPITIQSPDVRRSMAEAGCADLEFYSATYRLWNLPPAMSTTSCMFPPGGINKNKKTNDDDDDDNNQVVTPDAQSNDDDEGDHRTALLPLEPHCEDYGQAVRYRGTIPRFTSGWLLDKHHYFEMGRMHLVCGNTYAMLKSTPLLSRHFDFFGDFDTHYGIFDGCGTSMPYDTPLESGGGSTKGSCC